MVAAMQIICDIPVICVQKTSCFFTGIGRAIGRTRMCFARYDERSSEYLSKKKSRISGTPI